MKLGRKPPRVDHKVFKLSSFLKIIPPAPAKVSYIPPKVKWGVMLNDRLGDCAIAAPGHIIQAQTGLSGNEFVATDAEILAAYKAVSGYDGTGATDSGCNMQDVLDYWRKTGIAGHKILAYARVDIKNPAEVRYACYAMGGLYLGVNLPTEWEGAKVWGLPKPPVNIAGGHAITALQFDSKQLTVITWGKEIPLLWEAWHPYVEEAWAIFSPDWVTGVKLAPNGLNMAAVQKALSLL